MSKKPAAAVDSPPIVLRATVPITSPAVAGPGDLVLIWPDRVDVVRSTPNNSEAWLSLWMQGAVAAASTADADGMCELARRARGSVPGRPALRVVR